MKKTLSAQGSRRIEKSSWTCRLRLRLVAAVVSGMGLLAYAHGAAGQGFGLGAMIGEPTGVSAKIWQGRANAIDCALGWSLQHNYLHMVADYVWHNYGLIPVSSGQFPLYYGLGGSVVMANSPSGGVRMVVGLEYLMADAPLDVFMEVAPVAVIFPDPGIGLHGGLGMRYYF
jgi:hypothetical protein